MTKMKPAHKLAMTVYDVRKWTKDQKKQFLTEYADSDFNTGYIEDADFYYIEECFSVEWSDKDYWYQLCSQENYTLCKWEELFEAEPEVGETASVTEEVSDKVTRKQEVLELLTDLYAEQTKLTEKIKSVEKELKILL